MKQLTISLISPTSTFEQSLLLKATEQAAEFFINIASSTDARVGKPAFLNGTKETRLAELIKAESITADAIWAVRGGCGCIELLNDYHHRIYHDGQLPLIGYSDITILHFLRFYRAKRIGIHGPVFLDIVKDFHASLDVLRLLLNKRAQDLVYPALKSINHFLPTKLSGELVVMNMQSLQSLLCSFDPQWLRGKILALEDINEPPYRVFRSMQHLKNAGILSGLKALLLGHFNLERENVIADIFQPLAQELGFALFDWPIFGHELPNWPLLFGAKVSINQVDGSFFTLVYDEQHDHSPISHD